MAENRRNLEEEANGNLDVRPPDALIKTAAALQRAIFNSVNFSSIATDAQGAIIGYLLIMEKADFDRDRFTAEVRRAMSRRPLAA